MGDAHQKSTGTVSRNSSAPMDKLTRPVLLWPLIPWSTRCFHLLGVYITKVLLACWWPLFKVRAGLAVDLGVKPSDGPVSSKAYTARPKLRHRFFFPGSQERGSLLPVYINIHGGGFAFGLPAYDDEFCLFLSREFKFLVISVQYSLSPRSTFPTPVEDVVAVVEAILKDENLPIDPSRVAIGGFSAGGNLALSASQSPSLQGKIKAAVPWYSPVDWSVDYKDKLDSCPPRRAGDADSLAYWAPILNNAYLPPGTDLRDPRLSIIYADRGGLPEYIFAIGAEYDMLQDEARRMMILLAGELKVTEVEGVGFDIDDGRLRWRMVTGVEHGFTHWWWKWGDQAVAARQLAERWFTEVGNWLTEEAFTNKRETTEKE